MSLKTHIIIKRGWGCRVGDLVRIIFYHKCSGEYEVRNLSTGYREYIIKDQIV